MSDTGTSSPLPVNELSNLKPRNSKGALYFLLSTALTVTGIWLSLFNSIFVWAVGQIILAVALLQWFIILHEAGHRTLFRTKTLNTVAGHVAGLLSGSPYTSWTLIHFRHHKWTGWQDLDATTASSVNRSLSAPHTLSSSVIGVPLKLGNRIHRGAPKAPPVKQKNAQGAFDRTTLTRDMYRSKVSNDDFIPMTNRLRTTLLNRKSTVKGEYVFPGRHGGHKTIQNNRVLEAAFRRAGIGDISTHNMRKTFATRLLSRGAAITDV
jgi:hypothetical protein